MIQKILQLFLDSKDYIIRYKLTVYFDDVIIFIKLKDNYSYNDLYEEVIKIVANTGFIVNLKKSSITQETKILGLDYNICESSIRLPTNKIAAYQAYINNIKEKLISNDQVQAKHFMKLYGKICFLLFAIKKYFPCMRHETRAIISACYRIPCPEERLEIVNILEKCYRFIRTPILVEFPPIIPHITLCSDACWKV